MDALHRLRAFAAALNAARDTTHTAMGRLLGDSRGRRAERVAELARELAADAELLGVAPLRPSRARPGRLGELPQGAGRTPGMGRARARLRPGSGAASRGPAAGATGARFDADRRRIVPHFAGIVAIVAPPVAQPLDSRAAQAAQRICLAAANDRRRRWLRRRRRPARFRRYYSLFPKVAKILPCWAVTSLSARGRLPFEPGVLRPGGDRRSQPVRYRLRAAAALSRPPRGDHRRPAAAQARQHRGAAAGPPHAGGSRAGRRTRRLGLFGELAVRSGAQLVPLRGHRQPARPPPLAPRHHRVFQPPFLPRSAAHRHRS